MTEKVVAVTQSPPPAPLHRTPRATDLLPSANPPPDLVRRMWRPILTGGIVSTVFVFGTIAWASVFPIAGAVIAPSFIRVEDNRKTVKHRDGGIVRTLSVRDGDKVRRGDVLMTLDDTVARGQVEILQGQLDSYLAQRARFTAERDNATIAFPDELTSRKDHATVRRLLEDQQGLYRSRHLMTNSQVDIQKQKIQQVGTRIQGLQAQISAVAQQHSLIVEELEGTKTLYDKGLATKGKYLQLQRAAADLDGQRGNLLAEVARSQEAIAEAKIQIQHIEHGRITEASEGLRDVQVRIAELLPKLRSAEDLLNNLEVKAPADGYIHGLTQFTERGVIAAGERLLDVVPDTTRLVVEARLKPEDISKVTPDTPAQIRLTAYEASVVPTVSANVAKISADRITDAKTGEAYFTAELHIHPGQLEALSSRVRLYPGMPAEAMIATGERTIMDYLIAPFTNGLATAMR